MYYPGVVHLHHYGTPFRNVKSTRQTKPAVALPPAIPSVIGVSTLRLLPYILSDEDAMYQGRKIRVLVVDDHPMVRIGVAGIIQAAPDMTVVAQASTGEEAVPLFEMHRPDVSVVDLRLPGMSGVDLIRTVRARHTNSKFVVLTTYEDDNDIQSALKAGAHSCLIKGMSGKALVQALRRAHEAGRTAPLSAAMAAQSVE